jgi:hypothetical protein
LLLLSAFGYGAGCENRLKGGAVCQLGKMASKDFINIREREIDARFNICCD